MSIKSLEILPILIAINIVAKFKNIKRIIILSNSTPLTTQNHKYYENRIIETIQKHNHITFTIHWIPAHIGLIDHATT